MSHATLCFLSFNRPNLLSASVMTAVENAGYPVEVIVHDDGSWDDEVVDVIMSLREEGYISTVIMNSQGHNEGQGVALNRMFSMASGDYIAKLDQDLIFRENWLRTAVEICESDDRVGLLGLFRYGTDPVDYRKTRLDLKPNTDLYDFHTHICGSGFVVPRSTWELLKPFEQRNPSFSEDWDFQRRLHSKTSMFNALPCSDLVLNVGFGIGPSTIVLPGAKIQSIKRGPKVISR